VSLDWLAAVEPSSGGSDALGLLAQYGVLGIAAGLLVVFARASYKRETDRSDRLEGEVFRLHQVIQDRHIPALEAAGKALQEATLALKEIQQEREVDRAIRDRREGGR
jgi:hypothetical protein